MSETLRTVTENEQWFSELLLPSRLSPRGKT